MMALYVILTIIYSFIVFFLWMFKLIHWQVYDKSYKFRYLFKTYDLGMIIFPCSILAIISVIVICTILDILENPKMYIKIKAWMNKPLFKNKEDK